MLVIHRKVEQSLRFMRRMGVVEKFDVNGGQAQDSDDEDVDGRDDKAGEGASLPGGTSLLKNAVKKRKVKKISDGGDPAKPKQRRLLVVSPKLRVICKERLMTRQDAVGKVLKCVLKHDTFPFRSRLFGPTSRLRSCRTPCKRRPSRATPP